MEKGEKNGVKSSGGCIIGGGEGAKTGIVVPKEGEPPDNESLSNELIYTVAARDSVKTLVKGTLKSKSISRKGAKVLKAQRKQGGSSSCVSAAWRELLGFFAGSYAAGYCLPPE